ncbi:hypothetical protein [Cyclobacterium qasimii]|uniref:Ferritin/DPS protein domain-containing protein n=2 Tax=Cyclobacterium qasimii TaxID=1350429 RepID=A0A512C8H1_9BACT|nr:hypothetical protein [Cyclobacterium qasimii]GEO20508.1 hypothetical protein CQA01_10420 [Cyclobacterium qasimii]
MRPTETYLEYTDLSVKINIKIFQQLLADELVLYAKTLGASSRVITNKDDSITFFHDKIRMIEKALYIINNQIRKLNFNSQGTLKNRLQNANLNEFDTKSSDSEYFIRNLLDDHQLIIESIRKYLKDDFIYLNSNDSLNLIAEVLQLHIEMTWLLRDLLIKINYS